MERRGLLIPLGVGSVLDGISTICNPYDAIIARRSLTDIFPRTSGGGVTADAGVEDGECGCSDFIFGYEIHLGVWPDLDVHCATAVHCFLSQRLLSMLEASILRGLPRS